MIYTLTLNPAVDHELTVPALQFNSVLRASETRRDAGGKGLNVSRLLQSMGASSTAVAVLGGRTGQWLQDELQRLGIRTDIVWIRGETRTNFSVVTPFHETYLKVNERGPSLSEAEKKELLDRIHSLARRGDWWVLSGSLPSGMSDDLYALILDVLNQHEAQVILDTSGAPLRLACAERPYLVKPNLEEAQVLTGLSMTTPVEVSLAAARIRDLGAQNVVISMSKAGALLQTSKGTWMVRNPTIEEQNPIGAGDAMVGGLVWALAQGLPWKEAVRWGAAAGTATASLAGTAVGSRQQIEELFVQVEYEQLLHG